LPTEVFEDTFIVVNINFISFENCISAVLPFLVLMI